MTDQPSHHTHFDEETHLETYSKIAFQKIVYSLKTTISCHDVVTLMEMIWQPTSLIDV